jgi:hypothetical protein
MKLGTRNPRVTRSSSRATAPSRGKRKVATEAEILKRVLNFPAEFRHCGKSKRAPRIELTIKRFGASALKGDVGDADAAKDARAFRKEWRYQSDDDPYNAFRG